MKIWRELMSLGRNQRINFFLCVSSLTFLLFSYSIVRSTVTGIFLDQFGARKSPLVWLLSVVSLSITIFIYNWWQSKHSVKGVYFITSVGSGIFFILLATVLIPFNKYFAYVLFIWKEVYIVLLWHLTYAFLHNNLNVNFAKKIFGPMGALISLGGVFGGLATSTLTRYLNSEQILIFGSVILTIVGLFFSFFGHFEKEVAATKKQKYPLKSLAPVGKYVALIAAMVALNQIVTNIAHFKFNLAVGANFPSKIDKVEFLGKIQTWFNFLSFGIQIIIVPIVLKYVDIRKVHYAIPTIFLMIYFLAGASVLPVMTSASLIFIGYKGIDYSLYTVIKELLYFKLGPAQKYGAKYITDMVVYRGAKGLISFVLIFIQSTIFLDTSIIISLLLWIVVLFFMFKEGMSIPTPKES